MKDRGFIKLHRKITEWEWYTDKNTFYVFIHLLLNANHKPSSYRGYDVPAGSIVTGYAALSSQLNLSIRKIRTAISHLKSTQEVTIKTTSQFSIISLVKYRDYQDSNSTTTSKATSKRQASDKQATTSKECKNVRKKEYKTKTVITLPDFISEKTWSDVQEHRQKIKKPMTTRAESNLLAKLVAIHEAGISVDDAVDLLVEKGWASISVEWYRNAMESQKSNVVQMPVREVRQL